MKFKLTKKTKIEFGIKLFQIQALISFGNVKKGELGGWLQKEENLDQNGNAWVSGDARVYGDAWVYGKIKLKVGFYFGIKFQAEKIQELDNGDGTKIIWKK
jgi:hypothetical protein